MKKTYRIARLILTLLTFIFFVILFRNEDESWFVIPIILAITSFALSFPGILISEKIIKYGDKINNTYLKILYYILLPIILLLLCYLVYNLNIFLLNIFLDYSGVALSLGRGLVIIFGIIIICMFILIPYVLTLIILILKRFIIE